MYSYIYFIRCCLEFTSRIHSLALTHVYIHTQIGETRLRLRIIIIIIRYIMPWLLLSLVSTLRAGIDLNVLPIHHNVLSVMVCCASTRIRNVKKQIKMCYVRLCVQWFVLGVNQMVKHVSFPISLYWRRRRCRWWWQRWIFTVSSFLFYFFFRITILWNDYVGAQTWIRPKLLLSDEWRWWCEWRHT